MAEGILCADKYEAALAAYTEMEAARVIAHELSEDQIGACAAAVISCAAAETGIGLAACIVTAGRCIEAADDTWDAYWAWDALVTEYEAVLAEYQACLDCMNIPSAVTGEDLADPDDTSDFTDPTEVEGYDESQEYADEDEDDVSYEDEDEDEDNVSYEDEE